MPYKSKKKHTKRKRSKKTQKGGSKMIKLLIKQAKKLIKPNPDLDSFDSLLNKIKKLN